MKDEEKTLVYRFTAFLLCFLKSPKQQRIFLAKPLYLKDYSCYCYICNDRVIIQCTFAVTLQLLCKKKVVLRILRNLIHS